MTDADTIELYVGEAIEHASEREVLAMLIEQLSNTAKWAAIFANVNIGDRQIDFVVATDSLTLVVEAKHFSGRVRGGSNGLWQMHMSGSVWKNVGNPYLQALQAKNNLRDQLRAFFGEFRGYPDACVVITPTMPTGSDVPVSDFKVAITDLAGLALVCAKHSSLFLSKNQWRALAQELRLRRVQTLEHACNPKLLEQGELLESYRSEFLRTYSSDVCGLKKDSYSFGEEALNADQVSDRVVRGSDDLLIHGPSGCGKTLLAKKVATYCLEQGCIPIFLQAKYFAGKLSESIEREVVLLGAPSAASLLKAASLNGRAIVLLIDGYNECPADEQLALTRSIAALARSYGARLVISTQVDIKRPDLINAKLVEVKKPDKALKKEIAESSSGNIGHRLDYLLESVSSGLEADLLGRVGATLADGASRFALFDVFIRQKLGSEASDGIRLLAAVAERLIGHLSFSLSIRDFDRLAADKNVRGDVLSKIMGTELVVKRSDRVSFCHELVFSVFAAEAVVRQHSYDVESVLRVLGAPKYKSARSLIVGAYDDDEFIVSLLARTTDADLLRAALAGECGLVARHWVAARCEHLLVKLTSEAASLEFMLGCGSWGQAGIKDENISSWTPAECALLEASSDSVWRGTYLEQVLQAIGVMDESLLRGLEALGDEARVKKINLYDALFAEAYVFSKSTGLGRLLSIVFNSNPFFQFSDEEVVCLWKQKWQQPRTPGQSYLLLILTRCLQEKEFVVPFILPLLGEQWKYQPYHLRLELLNFVHFIRLTDDDLRQELVITLEGLLPRLGPVLSGMVIEALEQMGALEEEVDQHIDSVRKELRSILSCQIDEATCVAAWRMYVCRFDHPFSAAYYEVIDELDQENKKRLLMMACLGSDNAGLFLTPLIQELMEYKDRSITPAISKWLGLPAGDSFMPQESVSVFVYAHIAMGKLGESLPTHQETNQSQAKAAMAAFGRLYYWIHRQDLTPDECDSACSSALETLLDSDQRGAASTLRVLTKSMWGENGAGETVIRKFPQAMASICRNALREPDHQVSYFPQFFDSKLDILLFSVDLIGHVGGIEDVPYLRRLGEDAEVGGSAITAIRLIEQRAVNNN